MRMQVLVLTVGLSVPAWAVAQTSHTVRLDAAQEARLQLLVAARGQDVDAVVRGVLLQGIETQLGALASGQLARVQAVMAQLDPGEQTQVVTLAERLAPPQPIPQPPPLLTPVPGQGTAVPGPEPLGDGNVLGAWAALLLGSVLGWGGWLIEVVAIWGVAYLCWEAKPLRRLLFGVARRLYPRSLED